MARFDTPQFLSRVFIDRYISFGSLACLIYDHALTFDEEIQFVWCTSLSRVKLFFIVNRYLAPLGIFFDTFSKVDIFPIVSLKYCRIFYEVEQVWLVCFFILSYSVLATRVGSLYHNSRALRRLLFGAGITACAITVATTVISARKGNQTSSEVIYLADFRSCYDLPVPTDWITFVTPMVLDTIYLAFTLFHAWTCRMELLNMPLAHIIWRDGVIWFCLMIVTMGSIAIISGWYKEELIAPTTLAYMTCQVATSRIYFNLHRVSEEMVNPDLIEMNVAISGLEFVRPDSTEIQVLAEP